MTASVVVELEMPVVEKGARIQAHSAKARYRLCRSRFLRFPDIGDRRGELQLSAHLRSWQ